VEPQEIDVIESVMLVQKKWLALLSTKMFFFCRNLNCVRELLQDKQFAHLNIVLELLKDDQVNPCARQGAALLPFYSCVL